MEPEVLDAYSTQFVHFSHLHHQNVYYDNYGFIPLPPTPPSPSFNTNPYQDSNIFNNHSFNQRTHHYEKCHLPFNFTNSLPLKSSFVRPHSGEVSSHPFNNDASCDEPPLLFPSPQDFETTSEKLQHNCEENNAMEYFAEKLFNSKHETFDTGEHCYYQNEGDINRQIKIKVSHDQNPEWNGLRIDTSLELKDGHAEIPTTENFHHQCALSIESPIKSDDLGK